MFEDDRADAVILVDARNAFNSLNCQAAVHNIQIICPKIEAILVSTYRIPAYLEILCASDIYSLEVRLQCNVITWSWFFTLREQHH